MAAHELVDQRNEAISTFGPEKALTMSRESFASGFAQLLPSAERRAAFELHVMPRPDGVFHRCALGRGKRIGFGKLARFLAHDPRNPTRSRSHATRSSGQARMLKNKARWHRFKQAWRHDRQPHDISHMANLSYVLV
jgi:hypothetical protein